MQPERFHYGHKAMRRVEVNLIKESTTSQDIGKLFSSYADLAYMLPWQILDYVELLAVYNPDYSQAVGNIKTLANSGHNLIVEDSSKRRAKNVKSQLEEKARTIQESHGGIDGLIDKLLSQGAVYGAMCGEWIVNEDLTDVIDFVDINPKDIRFFKVDGKSMPHQKVKAKEAEEAKEKGRTIVNMSFIQLNPMTFRYFAFDAAPSSPYGTPPFLAALANIAIQRDMVANMAQIVKKIGLLGIIDLSVKQLQKMPSEDQSAFEARATQFLDALASVAQDMVRDGGLVHFDDVEAKTYSIAGNAAGATNIFKQNEELIFSGLKSMPSVQGRSYSTTETYAGVAYDIIIRNTQKYQRAAKRMVESGYWLMANLWGDPPDGIKINFNPNKTLHRLQDAQAEKSEIENAWTKWILGLIDQVGVAQELGYSQPKIPLADPPPMKGSSQGGGDDDEEETGEEEGRPPSGTQNDRETIDI